jgi:hypothetical protein
MYRNTIIHKWPIIFITLTSLRFGDIFLRCVESLFAKVTNYVISKCNMKYQYRWSLKYSIVNGIKSVVVFNSNCGESAFRSILNFAMQLCTMIMLAHEMY